MFFLGRGVGSMKAEFEINTLELVKEISKEVIKEIKPLLAGNHEPDELFSVESLSKYLGVSKQWIYERIHLKEIPYIKVGKFPRFKRSDINLWLDQHKIPAVSPLSRPLK